MNIFQILVEKEFKENPKILDLPNRLLNSECFKEKMHILYLKELFVSSS